jgi:membrane protein required for colicin V production
MSVWQFNWVDYVLSAIVLWSTITGFFKGILRTVFGLAGIVAGILLASWNYSTVADMLSRWITPKSTAQVIAFLGIALAMMVIFPIMGKSLRRMAEKAGLGGTDQLLGGAFGFAKGALIGIVLLMAMSAFAPDLDWVSDSQLTPYFLAGAHAVSFVVPNDLKMRITNGAIRLNQHSPVWTNRPLSD